MTAGTGRADGTGQSQSDRVAALLVDAQRVLAEVERLLAGAQAASVDTTARELAARQTAIIDAAHEEAAAVLAAAHADAARLLQRTGAPRGADPNPSVIDLRDGTAPVAVQVETPVAPAEAPAPAAAAADGAVMGDDVRATLSVAADMARRVSSRIERLSRDLQESSSP